MTDRVAIEVALIAAAGASMPSWVSVALAFMNRNKLTELHKEVNSRLSQLVVSSTAAAHAEGKAEGVTEERAKK
jgi:hypothetical protein